MATRLLCPMLEITDLHAHDHVLWIRANRLGITAPAGPYDGADVMPRWRTRSTLRLRGAARIRQKSV